MTTQNLINLEGHKGYYTCPCGKRYTAKIRKCEYGLLFENFHSTYVPILKEDKKVIEEIKKIVSEIVLPEKLDEIALSVRIAGLIDDVRKEIIEDEIKFLKANEHYLCRCVTSENIVCEIHKRILNLQQEILL